MSFKHAPVTVWSFIALMVGWLIFSALPGDPTVESPVGAVLFTLLWSYVLLRGSRVGWWLVTGIYVLALLSLTALMIWPWDAVAIGLIAFLAVSLGLLLAPQTRAWVGVGRRRDSPAGSG